MIHSRTRTLHRTSTRISTSTSASNGTSTGSTAFLGQPPTSTSAPTLPQVNVRDKLAMMNFKAVVRASARSILQTPALSVCREALIPHHHALTMSSTLLNSPLRLRKHDSNHGSAFLLGSRFSLLSLRSTMASVVGLLACVLEPVGLLSSRLAEDQAKCLGVRQ